FPPPYFGVRLAGHPGKDLAVVFPSAQHALSVGPVEGSLSHGASFQLPFIQSAFLPTPSPIRPRQMHAPMLVLNGRPVQYVVLTVLDARRHAAAAASP